MPVASDVDVRLRLGFDLNPLDFLLDEDVAWGRACIWAGAVEREARFERAVSAWRNFDRKTVAPTVHKLNASLVPARLPDVLSQLPETGLLIVYQTLVGEYMDPAKRKQYEEGLHRWLATVSPGRGVWIEGECWPDRPSASMHIVAYVPDGSGGVRSIELGWTAVHPTIVHVNGAGVKEFKDYFADIGPSGPRAVVPSRAGGLLSKRPSPK